MADPFAFDPYSGLAPGGLPDVGTPVWGRGYELVGERVFARDLGPMALPVHGWIPFASTNVDSAYWAPVPDLTSAVGSLFVRFLSYAVYRYDGVPELNWAELLASPSHGQYVANVIVPNWQGIRIQGPMRKATKEIIEAHSGRSHV